MMKTDYMTEDEQIRAKALQQAISIAGSIRKLADRLNRNTPTVAAWKRRNTVPANSVLAIERATGVSRHLIRPDIYPMEDGAK